MTTFGFYLLCLLLSGVFADTKPQQIHIAFTGRSDEMNIMWATVDETPTSTVQYGNSSDLNLIETGSFSHYYLPFYESPALHTVTIKGLAPSTTYYYRVGDSNGGWSNTFSFQTKSTLPVTPQNPLKIAVLADNGDSANSDMVFDAIMKKDKEIGFDFLILSGDLSYANGFQYIWDQWQNMVEPFATHAPMMLAPGNHEAISLFIPYNYRFQMPTNGWDNLYYSFNYRNVHVLILNSESLDEFHFSSMYQFAASDLQRVNREETPWIIAAWHHPWYCSNAKHEDSAWFMKDEYEALFYKMKVDLVLQGHVHAYERTHPVYNWSVDSSATTYMTDGHGGNKEGLYYDWDEPQPSWSAYRESVFGFSTMEIFNSTHLHWQMIRGNDSYVRDDFWIVRER